MSDSEYRYRVVVASGGNTGGAAKVLEADVNELMQQGWIPTGGVAMWDGYAVQAMIMPEEAAPSEPPWEEERGDFSERLMKAAKNMQAAGAILMAADEDSNA